MESTKERRIGSEFNRYYDKLNMFRNTVLLFSTRIAWCIISDPALP